MTTQSIGCSNESAISNYRITLSQVCAVMVKNYLLVAFGMTLAFPTILLPHLSKHKPDEEFYLNQEGRSWIAAIGSLCVPLGCCVSGLIVSLIGRKKAMQLVCVPYVICCLGFKFSTDVWQIFMGLAINGFVSGLLEAPVLTYVAEITTPELRGILSATASLAFHVGFLTEVIIGKYLSWRDTALVTSIGPFICFFLLFIIPESPRWLIARNRNDDAKRSLAWLRGWTTVSKVEKEFQDMLNKHINRYAVTSKSSNFLEKYLRSDFINPLALVCFMFLISAFCGHMVLSSYSIMIFETLQSPIDKNTSTIMLEVSCLLGSFVCIVLIKYAGKRVMIFQSLGIGSLCMLIVATYAFATNILYFEDDVTLEKTVDDVLAWLPLITLVLSVFAFQTGIKTIPWVLIGEIFSKSTSAIGSGLCAAIAHVFSFATRKVFLDAVAHFTLPGTFWFFGVVGLVGIAVLYFWLPETEGKTLQEITDHFAGVTPIDNKVHKNEKNGVI